MALQEVADAFFDWFDADDSSGIDLFEWTSARSFDPHDAGLPDVMSLAGIDLNGDEFVKTGEFMKVLKDIIPAKTALAWFKYILAISAQ